MTELELSRVRKGGFLGVGIRNGGRYLGASVYDNRSGERIHAEGLISLTHEQRTKGAITQIYERLFRVLQLLARRRQKPVEYVFTTDVDSPMAGWLIQGGGRDFPWSEVTEEEDQVSARISFDP